MEIPELKTCFDYRAHVIILTGGTGVLGQEIACALVGCGAQKYSHVPVSNNVWLAIK